MRKSFITCLCLVISIILNTICVNAEDVRKIDVLPEGDTYFEAECESAYINFPYEPEIFSDGVENLKVSKSAGFRSNPQKNDPLELYYYLNIQKAGKYFIWQRVYAQNSGSDSAWYTVDGGSYSSIEYESGNEWKWYSVGVEYFEPGVHRLEISHREVEVRTDKFLITTIPDSNPGGERLSTPTKLPKTGESKDLLYNLPPCVPSMEHPRLLVRKSDIDSIKKNFNHPQNEGAYKALLEYADMDLSGVLPPLKSGQTTNVNCNDLACAESNAFLYLTDSDETRGKKAISIAKNAISTMLNRSGNDDITRYGGYCIFVVSEVYDWCYPLLSEEDKNFIRSYAMYHAKNMEVGWPPVKQGNVTGHATEGQLFRDLLGAGVAMYDEDPYIYNTVAGRLLDELIPSRNLSYNSTFFSEGQAYGSFRYFYELICERIFNTIGYNVFSPKQKNAMYSTMYNRRPDGRFIQTGDDFNERLWGYNSSYGGQAFLAGNIYKDPYLKSEYYKSLPYGASASVGVTAITPVTHLIFNDVDVEVGVSQTLPLTTFSGFPLGSMYARTSWNDGQDSDAVVVQMNIQQRFFSSHQHKDSGHFDIYYKGSLALDSGMYQSAPFYENGVSAVTGYSSDHSLYYYKQSIAHNTMLVYDPKEETTYGNHGGQRGKYGVETVWDYEDMNGENAVMGEVLSYDFGPDLLRPAYSYLKGDISKAYSDKVEKYQRTFVFLNMFDKAYPAAMIVFDNIKSKDASFKKTWLLHSQEEPVIKDNTTIIKRTEYGYGGRLINETLLPENPKIKKVGGEGNEYLVNDKNYKAVLNSPVQEAGNWRIELSPSTSSKQDYFLNVLQVSDNDDGIAPLKSELVEDNKDFLGVKIKDRVVLLKKDGIPTYKNIDITLPQTDEKLMYIVTGLESGKWEVRSNGKTIASELVAKGHDSICFEAESGSFTLEWTYMSDIKPKDYSIDTIKVSAPSAVHIKIDDMFKTFEHSPYVSDKKLYIAAEDFLNSVDIKYNRTENKISVPGYGEFIVGKNGTQISDNVIYAEAENLVSTLKMTMQWDCLGRVAFIKYGKSILDKLRIVNSDNPARVKIESLSSSSGTEEPDYNSVDGNEITRWAARGSGEWIMYEFTEPSSVSAVELCWWLGHTRKETFDMLLSNDGVNWKKVYSGQSDGVTSGFEKIKIKDDGVYKYLKIVGFCNTSNDMNSLSEIRIYK